MPDIYTYTNIANYLADTLSEKKTHNPRFSLRAWSRQLGQRNPSLLSDVINGKRPASVSLAKKMVGHLGLSEPQARYFRVLVLKAASKKQDQNAIYDAILQSLGQDTQQRELDLDTYHLVGDWYHSAILEMFDLHGFTPTPQWIARRLGGSISEASVKVALERLERFGLFRRDADGSANRCGEHVHVGCNVPSSAIRNHHVEMIEKAKQAVEGQPPDRRHLYGTTLAIGSENYNAAVHVIESCHHQLKKLAAKENGDHVYRLNTQFFELTSNLDTDHNEK